MILFQSSTVRCLYTVSSHSNAVKSGPAELKVLIETSYIIFQSSYTSFWP